MLRLSMNEITTFRWTFDQDVDNYQAAGYDSIGIWLQKLIDFGEERAVDLLAERRLHVTNVVWAGGFTGSDGRTLEESISDTVCALRQSAAIRAGCLTVYAGGRNNHTFRHARRLLHAALDELLPVAEVVEVPMALEPMHPVCAKEFTFLTDLDQTLEIVEQYDTPYLKLALDTYHFPLAFCDQECLSRLISRLAVVYLGDRIAPPNIDQDRCLLGTGCIPLRETVTTLIKGGYRGDFDVKLMGQEIESTCYWTLLDKSRELYQQTASSAAPIPAGRIGS